MVHFAHPISHFPRNSQSKRTFATINNSLHAWDASSNSAVLSSSQREISNAPEITFPATREAARRYEHH
eukprot:scaffold6397_cov121-Isochrysis_galbana.AAC.14